MDTEPDPEIYEFFDSLDKDILKKIKDVIINKIITSYGYPVTNILDLEEIYDRYYEEITRDSIWEITNIYSRFDFDLFAVFDIDKRKLMIDWKTNEIEKLLKIIIKETENRIKFITMLKKYRY